MENLSDIQLIKSFDQNRNEALAEIYKRYSALVYGVCLKYLGSREKSLDAVVGVFELLIKKVASQEITNFSSWLYSVTKNHCLMILRKEKSEFKHKNEFYLELKLSESLDHKNDDLRKYESVQEALCLLSIEQKECVTKFYFDEMSYNEISNATGYSVKSVKSYLQNGKAKLKKIMEEQRNANSEY